MSAAGEARDLLAMEDIHETGAESWWREAWYFAFYDQERNIGVTSYCGVFPNQRRADLMFDIVRDERSAHRYLNLDLRLPPDVGRERLQLGPQSVEMLEPGERWALRYDHGRAAVNVTFEATEPLNSWEDAGVSMETDADSQSRHTDQAGRFTGTILLDDERIEIDALGMRDRMWGWGGRKEWLNYAMLWAPYEDGTIVNIVCMQFTDGRIELAGHLTRDGKRALLDEATVELRWDPERWKSVSHIDSWIRDELGREATLVSYPVATIDSGAQWGHRDDHLLFSTGRHELGDQVAYGCCAWSYMRLDERPSRFDVKRATA